MSELTKNRTSAYTTGQVDYLSQKLTDYTFHPVINNSNPIARFNSGGIPSQVYLIEEMQAKMNRKVELRQEEKLRKEVEECTF